jgi:outer membrane protein assembly factor BamB
VWQVKAGLGHSSPVVADGKVYLFSLVGNQEVLAALDAASGKMLWTKGYNGGWTTSYKGTRATPTIEGDRIYTYGGAGDLVCWDLATGKPRWDLNVLRATGARPLTWGQASSPLVLGDLVYVQGGDGGAVAVAVNKETGKLAWKSQASGLGGYAAVVDAEVESRPQLIVFGGRALYGMDPRSGKTLWETPWPTEYDVNAATPIFHDGKVFVSSAYGKPPGRCALFQVSASGVRKVWENREITARFQPAVLDDGYVYGNSEGTLKCLAWSTGKLQWAAKDKDMRLTYGGSLLRAGDKLLTLSDRGELSLLRATPAEVKLLSQVQLFDGREIWATPVVSGGKLYAKGNEELVCVEVGGQ